MLDRPIDAQGKYEVQDLLGRGGMGSVYRARHRALNREIALKVMDQRVDPDAVARFRREMEVCAALPHPGIVRVLEWGELASGELYYAMELVRGRSLAALIKAGAVPLGEVASIVRQTAEVLAFLHERDRIHRDIKPDNVMVQDDGAVKVMDFGVVKALERTVMTQQGAVLGTPLYLAPEVIFGQPDAPPRDVYALGLVAWELIVGFHPCPARTLPDVLAWIASEPVPAVGEEREVPGWLAALVERMTLRTPERRPTAAEVAQACADQGRAARKPAEPRKAPRASTPPSAPPSALSSPRVVLPAAALMFAAAFALPFLAMRGPAETTTSPPAPATPSTSIAAPSVAAAPRADSPPAGPSRVRQLAAFCGTDSVHVKLEVDPPAAVVLAIEPCAGGPARRLPVEAGRRFADAGGLQAATDYRLAVLRADSGAPALATALFTTADRAALRDLEALLGTGRLDAIADESRLKTIVRYIKRSRYHPGLTGLARAVREARSLPPGLVASAARLAAQFASPELFAAVSARLPAQPDLEELAAVAVAAKEVGDPGAAEWRARAVGGTPRSSEDFGRADSLLALVLARDAASAGLVVRWLENHERASPRLVRALVAADPVRARTQLEAWAADERPRFRRVAQEGFAALGAPEDVRRLGGWARAAVADTRRDRSEGVAAVGLLAEHGSDEALALVVSAVSQAPDEPRWVWAALRARRMTGPFKHNLGTALLAMMSEAPSDRVRAALLSATAQIAGKADERVIAHLTDPSDEVRAAAAWVAGTHAVAAAGPALVKMASGPVDPFGVAAWALGRMRERTAATALIERLETLSTGGSPADDGRVGMLGWALRRMDDPPSREAVKRLLQRKGLPDKVRALVSSASAEPGHDARCRDVFAFPWVRVLRTGVALEPGAGANLRLDGDGDTRVLSGSDSFEVDDAWTWHAARDASELLLLPDAQRVQILHVMRDCRAPR